MEDIKFYDFTMKIKDNKR